MGRTARGVTGMRFKIPGDDVVSLEIIREHVYSDEEPAGENETEVEVDVDDEAPVYGSGPEVLVVTDGGMGKRSCVSTYRKTNRGAKGVVNIRLREGESVLSVVQITEEDEILLTTERGQLVRIPAKEIRRVGRASKGVRIMNLNAGDRITGVAKLVEVEAPKSPAEETSEEASAPENGAPAEAVVPEVPASPEAEADGEPGGGE